MKLLRRYLLHCLFLAVVLCSHQAWAGPTVVSLAPHLTEWVYSLDYQDKLLAVSAHSDYPAAASHLPQVADANGVDIKAIVKLQPDLILAWQGGNKPQDIARLRQLGFAVFESAPRQPADISREIRALATQLGIGARGQALTAAYDKTLARLQARYQTAPPRQVFYYLWPAPLMSVSNEAWAAQLLGTCNAHNVFADADSTYPQVSIQEVLRRQPDFLVAATGRDKASEEAVWAAHRQVLSAPLIVVNPDHTSRFTLRLLPALTRLCQALHPALATPPAR